MRLVAVDALGRIGRPPASALLMEALDDPQPVRARPGDRGAVAARCPRLARRLTDIVRSDHSPDVRRIAEVALARAGGADAQSGIVSLEFPELGIARVGLALLRDLLTERIGLHYADDREDVLAERLASIAIDRGFRSYLDLFYLLKYEDNPADWARVMDELSVPETYFWREIDQIRAVVESGRPGAGAQQATGARCGSGACPARRAKSRSRSRCCSRRSGWFNRIPIELHGSDASPASTRTGQATACTGSVRFARCPASMKEKYFEPVGGGWRPIASLQHACIPGRWSTCSRPIGPTR